jgi:outer membrane immunogenic protein
MKFIFPCATALVAVLAAHPAMAQDAKPFAGFHADVEGGWARVGGDRIPSDGFVYGGKVGYDLALANIRIGPELEVTGSTQKYCEKITRNSALVESCERTDRDFYAGGRLGYVLSSSAMLYAKVGYTSGRFADRIGSDKDDWHARNLNGVRVGGGLEYALSPRFYLSGEYRYSHYNRNVHQNQIMSGVGVRF